MTDPLSDNPVVTLYQAQPADAKRVEVWREYIDEAKLAAKTYAASKKADAKV